MFHRAPQALDHHVIAPSDPAIHADGYLLAQQHAREGVAGELAALIGVEYLRFPEARQRLDAEVGLHSDRHQPSQDLAAEPVDDGREIDEPHRHRDVADVRCPDLIGPHDQQFAQQIRVDLVPRRRLRCVQATVDCFDRHLLHQRGDMLAADLDAFLPQQIAQHPTTRKRKFQVQLVDPPHDRQISAGAGLGR